MLRRYQFKNPLKRLLVGLFDAAGFLLSWPVRLIKRTTHPAEVRKILVIRTDGIGDVVMAYPAIRALRQRYPDAGIDLLTSPEGALLFSNDRSIDSVLEWKDNLFSKASRFQKTRAWRRIIKELKNRKYDIAFDFRGDLRHILMLFFASVPRRISYAVTGGGFLLENHTPYPYESHQVYANMELLRAADIELAPVRQRLQVSDKVRQSIEKKIGTPSGRGIRFAVQPGAGYPSKEWDEDKFTDLIKRICREKLGSVWIIGSDPGRPSRLSSEGLPSEVRDLRGQTTLDELPFLLQSADVYIGNDSGPAHIAAAQDIEVVSIFSGTNDVSVWHPWTTKLHIVTVSVPCSPCSSRICPLGHHDCMARITVDQVFDKVLEASEAVGKQRGKGDNNLKREVC